MDTRYASRKFILTAFLLVAAIILLLYGFIDQDTWARVTTWVLGLYITGNVGSYVAAKMKATA